MLQLLVGKGLLSPEWAERILAWRYNGFSVHSLVRAQTKPEAERVGKYIVRPILALERLSFLESEGKVGCRHGEEVRPVVGHAAAGAGDFYLADRFPALPAILDIARGRKYPL